MTYTTRIVRRYVPDDEVEYVLSLLRGDGCRMVEQHRQAAGVWTLIADCPAANLISEALTPVPAGTHAELMPAAGDRASGSPEAGGKSPR